MAKRNFLSIISGIMWGLVPPISTRLHFAIPYKLIGYRLAFGPILVDWIWFFVAGMLVGLIGQPRKFYHVLLVSFLTPILAAIYYSFALSGGIFGYISEIKTAIVLNIVFFTIFASLGYLVTFLVKKNKSSESVQEVQV